MRTRKKKTESTDAARGDRGVPGRHHYEYAPPESIEQEKRHAVRSARPDAGANRTRSVKE
jgi:hypothetical protein